MTYQFTSGALYRMPTHFGPAPGPRQDPSGGRYNNVNSPKSLKVGVSFLTDTDALDALLPPRFEVLGEPVVNVEAAYMKDVIWLAGRGYNTLGVRFPARFVGDRDTAEGDFLAVLWESLADPIITGRDEIGFSKVFCDLPEPAWDFRSISCVASWMGFEFAQLQAGALEPVDVDPSETPTPQLHFKYVPGTGAPDAADAAYPLLSPRVQSQTKVLERWRGDGTVTFKKARFEDLPTLFHIVNALHALPIREPRGAVVSRMQGSEDFRDQQRLQ